MKKCYLLVIAGLLGIILGVSIGKAVEASMYEEFLKDFVTKYEATSWEIKQISAKLKDIDNDIYILQYKQSATTQVLQTILGEDEDEDEDEIIAKPAVASDRPKPTATPIPTPRASITTPIPTPRTSIITPTPTTTPVPYTPVPTLEMGSKTSTEELLSELSVDDLKKLIKLLEIIN